MLVMDIRKLEVPIKTESAMGQNFPNRIFPIIYGTFKSEPTRATDLAYTTHIIHHTNNAVHNI